MAPAWLTTGLLVVGGDVHVIHYPWFVLWRDSLAAGEFPFWNPYSFSGIPAFATLQAGYGYPPHWLLTPLPPILAINWLVGLHVLLAGLGTAWTAGRLGASREGQVLAGLAYALGSAMVARMWAGHLSFLEANAWLPLATGLAVEISGRRRVVLLALVVALMTLAGQPEIVIFSLWWLPLWAGVRRRAGRPTGDRAGRGPDRASRWRSAAVWRRSRCCRSWRCSAISNRAGPDGVGLPHGRLAAALAPARAVRAAQLRRSARRLLARAALRVARAPALRRGSCRCWRRGSLAGRWRWLCWGAAGIAVAFAFGGYAPWYPLVELLPGYANLRIPSKHLVLAALALALAAGVGLERLHGGGRPAPRSCWPPWWPCSARRWISGCRSLAALLGGSELMTSQARRTLAGSTSAGVLVAVVVLVLAALAMRLPSALPRRAILVALAALELILVLQPFRLRSADPAQIVADERGASGPTVGRR